MKSSVKFTGSNFVTTITARTIVGIKVKALPLRMRELIIRISVSHETNLNIRYSEYMDTLGINDGISLISNSILVDGSEHDDIDAYSAIENKFNMIMVDNANDFCHLSRLIYNKIKHELDNLIDDNNFMLESVGIE